VANDLTPDEKVSEITQIFLNEYDQRWKKKYEEFEQVYDYLGGNQYTAKQIKFYNSFRRPTDVFNIIFGIFNAVMGDLISTDNKVKLFPTAAGTPEVAQSLEKLLKHYDFNDRINFNDQILQTALAGCVGFGYAYTRWSDELEIDGGVVTTNDDEFDVLFDSRARDWMLDDAVYTQRHPWMTVQQILAGWPQHRGKLNGVLRDVKNAEIYDNLPDNITDFITHPDLVYEKENKYRVVEHFEMAYERHEVAVDGNTNDATLFTLQGAKRELFLRANPQIQIIDLPDQRVKKKTTILPGLHFMLEDTKDAEVQDGTHDIVLFAPYPYGKKTIDHFGLGRNSIGPQKNFNQWRNQTQHIINQSANIGAIMNLSAFENPQDAKNYGKEAGLNLYLKDGYDATQAFKEGSPPKFPFATDKMSQEAIELFYKITQITPNIQGLEQSSGENASLFANRVQQAKKTMEIIHLGLRRLKKRLIEKRTRFIQHHLTEERYFVITNPQKGTQEELFVNLQVGDDVLNNLQVGEYQVIAEMADSDPFSKRLRFMEKFELATFLRDTFGPAAIDPRWLLEDLEDQDIEKVIARIEAVLQAQMASSGEDEAMQGLGNLMTLAKQKQDLERPEPEAAGAVRNGQQSQNGKR